MNHIQEVIMTPGQCYIIAMGTLFLVVFSWKFSIRAKRYHGIARFFAFESLLVMITLNSGPWFQAPGIPQQIVSWFFLGISIYMALHGAFLLVKMGKPKGDLENTSKLVTTGLYGLIRHPLYASLVYLGFGAFLKQVTPVTVLLVVINTIALFITAKVEEGEMLAKFGEEYRNYMKVTKRFIPFVF
jgi:protein-S-isoprenylcysteine O-methyltransferase Ste14